MAGKVSRRKTAVGKESVPNRRKGSRDRPTTQSEGARSNLELVQRYRDGDLGAFEDHLMANPQAHDNHQQHRADSGRPT